MKAGRVQDGVGITGTETVAEGPGLVEGTVGKPVAAHVTPGDVYVKTQGTEKSPAGKAPSPPAPKPADSTSRSIPKLPVDLPMQLFIGGKFVQATGGTSEVVNPATEEILAAAPLASAADVDVAVASAKEALASKVWSGKSGAQRAEILDAVAQGIYAQREGLAKLECLNQGKPYTDALGDIDAVAGCFAHYANLARALDLRQDRQVELPAEGYSGTLRYYPVGVVGAITPWNYPMLMAAWKVAPALAAGCSVVLKPSELTPLTAMAMAKIAHEAGVPAGVLNVVPGRGGEAGQRLVEHPNVAKVTFTGGTETGKKIGAVAAAGIKPFTAELGGKSPVIVFDDAELERTANVVFDSIFGNQGEVCNSTSRLIVQEGIAPRLLQRLKERAEATKVGNGLRRGVYMGPLVSKTHYDKVMGYIQKGLQEGATLLCGGKRPEGLDGGYFVLPTVFTNVEPNMTLWREEIFGPVLCVKTFKTEAEAIALANDSDFGLAGAVFTGDRKRAERVVDALEVGMPAINDGPGAFLEMPWSGWKQSGLGTEHGADALMPYLRVKGITRFAG